MVDSGADERSRRHVRKTYGFESGLPRVELLDLMVDDQETVFPYSFLEGQAAVSDIVLLKSLARRQPDCRFLEIGTWRGESLANVAAIADRCVSVSLSSDEMRTMGMPAEFIDTHSFFTRRLTNVTHVAHDSQTFDFLSLNETFHLAFIDGDHSRRAIASDTKNVFSVLHDENSVIVWHDYGHTPEDVRWDVFAGILDGCPPWAIDHLYHVSNTQCAIFSRQKLTTRPAKRFEPPRAIFRITIEAPGVDDPKTQRLE